jgi:hypothetical protein
MKQHNPFEYVGANDLPGDTILDYYIEDFNFSRFIKSPRNILLVGERGCGKSMTLLFNSFPVQQLRALRGEATLSLNYLGVYVPCNTPLTHKREFQLLDDFRASVVSEHHLVLSIAFWFSKTLSGINNLVDSETGDKLTEQLSYLFGQQLPASENPFTSLMQFVERENLIAQRAANSSTTTDVFFENTYSFASIIVPLIRIAKSIDQLRDSHFAFLIDDAQDLNLYQQKALFSWIAYRDHSSFSFKVALANINKTSLNTSSGGSILEGHDFTRIDMMHPIHNENDDFGQLADQLICRRLKKCGISLSPEDFFPVSERMKNMLAEAEAAVREEAVRLYGNDSKRVSDYIYKYKRAHLFRSRSSKANRLEYSGFDMLVFLSTGVIRNLLIPCYWMYDKTLSVASLAAGTSATSVSLPYPIPPNVQSEVILSRSRAMWDWLRNELDKSLEGCSRDDARHAYQLLDNLAILFRERLLRHKSEPRANSFTISQQDAEVMKKLTRVLETLIAAQLLYVRSGPAKDKGKRENYFIPNRMLWPERGLDPQGQHARVSLKARDLWAAAEMNRQFPFVDDDEPQIIQRSLFDE